LADVVLKKRCKLLTFFTMIFAVLLHDLASSYQISSKRDHSRQSFDVISMFKNNGNRTENLHPTLALVKALV